MDHQTHMRRAIDAARRNPECPFGAVLVDSTTDAVVAEGHNRTFANPTWHGEIDAINRFAQRAAGDEWPRLHLYTTAEPCPMCQGAILWAGIPAVFYGTSIRRLQQLGWRQIDLLAEEVARRSPFTRCEVVGDILADECDRLFASAARLSESRPGKGA